MDYDVLIVGAGVTGAAIARELSRYDLTVGWVEAGDDVAHGASRANSAIVHAGYDCEPGSLMAELNVKGNAMMPGLCRELGVHFKPIGSMVVAFGPEEEEHLRKLKAQGEANGVPGLELRSGDRAREREPNLNPEITEVLWAPTAGITCPYMLTIALAESAVTNGAALHLDFKVKAIAREEALWRLTAEDGREVSGYWLINAAGNHADTISRLAGGMDFRIAPRKGEYLLLDRKEGAAVGTVIFPTPTSMGKGILVSPTVDGNVFAGPTAMNIQDPDDTSTTAEGLAEIRKFALRNVPSLNLGQVITSFAGVRAAWAEKHDFLIQADTEKTQLVQAAGIQSPGLTAAPAIGVYVTDILRKGGLQLREKPCFRPLPPKKKPFRNMSRSEQAAAIAENPLYGRIICRCETVTEAEIVEAVHRPVPARSLDAVKRRTRAGMGRCQAGFCSPRVMEILARELGTDMTRVTKSGGGSWLVCGRIKEEPHA